MTEMVSEMVEMSPAMATELLKLNHKNRKLNYRHIQDLKDAIWRGEWKLTPQPIIVSDNNRLLDGQHRLSAIVVSGQTVPVYLFTGASEEIFDVIDIGKKRSYADAAGIHKKVAHAITTLARYYYPGTKHTHQQVHLIKDIYLEAANALFDKTLKYNTKFFSQASIKAAATYMVQKTGDIDYISETYSNILNYEFQKLPPYPWAFARIGTQVIGTGKRLNPEEVFCMAIKIFNKEKQNTKLLRRGGDRKPLDIFKEYTDEQLKLKFIENEKSKRNT